MRLNARPIRIGDPINTKIRDETHNAKYSKPNLYVKHLLVVRKRRGDRPKPPKDTELRAI
jgi:hypothetical protein